MLLFLYIGPIFNSSFTFILSDITIPDITGPIFGIKYISLIIISTPNYEIDKLLLIFIFEVNISKKYCNFFIPFKVILDIL